MPMDDPPTFSIIRLDRSGNEWIGWEKELQGPSDAIWGFEPVALNDSHYYVAWIRSESGWPDVLALSMFDSDSTEVWRHERLLYDEGLFFARAVLRVDGETRAVTMASVRPEDGQRTAFMTTYDYYGNEKAHVVCDAFERLANTIHRIALTEDGRLYVVGSFGDAYPSLATTVVCFDENGRRLWRTELPRPLMEAISMAVDDGGNAFVHGVRTVGEGNDRREEYWLAVIDASGALSQFGTPGLEDEPTIDTIAIDDAGDLLMTGGIGEGDDKDVYVAKYARADLFPRH